MGGGLWKRESISSAALTASRSELPRTREPADSQVKLKSTRSDKYAAKVSREQVVVLMGASSGIGRETALRFAERGAKVVV